MSGSVPMASTGIHASPAELAAVDALARELGTSKSRILRAALRLASEVGTDQLRVAVNGLDPLCGLGSQSGVFLPLAELTALDRLAADAGVSRSRLARAAVGLFLEAGGERRRGLAASLPVDGRVKLNAAA